MIQEEADLFGEAVNAAARIAAKAKGGLRVLAVANAIVWFVVATGIGIGVTLFANLRGRE